MIKVTVKQQLNTYNEENLLQLDTIFQPDKVTQIFGPSGAGKTTLLKIIAGLATPQNGKVTVDETVWLDTDKGVNVSPQLRRVGFVFQDYALFPNMTVMEHLQFGTQDAALIKQLIELGRLEKFLKHRPRQLSGGQQQRLSILRALSIQSPILLMDEPFSALDYSLRRALIADLKSFLFQRSVTCLIVSHNPDDAEDFADHLFEISSP